MGRKRRRKGPTEAADPVNVFGRVLSPDTGRELGSVQFADFRSLDIDPTSAEMSGKVYPVGVVCTRNIMNGEGGGDAGLEPFVGMEFDSADDARDFYNLYAARVGFKMRIGQLYRSRVDGSVSNRRFVCSKEGFQINSRTGCPAFIRVKKCDSGKWVIDQFAKDHNHELEPSGEDQSVILEAKTPLRNNPIVDVPHRPRTKLLDVVNPKRAKIVPDVGQDKIEPCIGLEFNTANEAYQFYNVFAMKTGFRVRIGQLFRSKLDGSITSRRFVCSKEGFQHPSRVGCGAFMRIKRQDNGTWVVDRHQMHHNHELELQMESSRSLSSKKLVEEINGGLLDKDETVVASAVRPRKAQHRANNIESDWYNVLLNYFQGKQAEDTGFFYALEIQMGRSRSIFWADGRSRFSCSQFGDAVVFDTSYRSGDYSVPFATFTGINHHKQPVLLGCALIADESKETFAWLFETWARAMSGCRPKSIIADQDKAIREAIAQVFPGTHHRFSAWQMKAKENENLGSLSGNFKYEYDRCIYQSQTTGEFDSAWNTLLHKYNLVGNEWLKLMYEYRENWVPLYLRGTFFAGIPVNGSPDAFFGAFLSAQTPLREFVPRYERALEQRREEERKEDFNSFNLQAFLQTSEPVEEQCRRLYTLAIFKVFQKEILQSYGFLGSKIYEEGPISRYLVRRGGATEIEKHIVTFNASDLEASCGCQMFESEGVLCRHVLRLFQMLDVREIPSRYILHRWTRNAEYGGIARDIESGISSQEQLKAMMKWSLQEMASRFVESGISSYENYKLAYEIMRDGGRKLCWQR
ncbi:protein FAR1-RELATED SEQUENCE 7-like isoform X1 [Punica granatum]|uniref:Protein FAR1-RELATED SEQUENCE n=2 Tax=Punica granatum TaxID=22663 RepID=A0A218X135_PUNGR|nr:protein FAR1-RELATED SEQUENCE 7-like isoform X1 [Punica granatum]OWM78518.1 hypothetical protein CDL15_Pgr016242 [Punica granatum]